MKTAFVPASLFVLISTALGCGGRGRAPVTPTTTAAEVKDGTVASFDGVSIHYESTAGSPTSAVVLVHCWSCDMHDWDAQMSALSPRWRVVRLDLAGHGKSGKTRKDWTIQAYGQDVRAVVSALGLDHVVLVGHSMGGPVILEAAALMPDKVVGLVPIDTLHDAERVMPEEQKKALFAHFRQDFQGTTRELIPHMFPPTSDKALVERIAAEEAAADSAVAIPSLESLYNYDEKAGLSRIKAPIIAINADLFPTSLEHDRKYAPQFDAVIVKGVGHWLMREKPDVFNARLVEVLQKLAPPAA